MKPWERAKAAREGSSDVPAEPKKPWEVAKEARNPSILEKEFDREGAVKLWDALGNAADLGASPFAEGFNRGVEGFEESPVSIDHPAIDNPLIQVGETVSKAAEFPFRFDYGKAAEGFKDQLSKNIERPFQAPAEAAPYSESISGLMKASPLKSTQESAGGATPHILGLGMNILTPAPENAVFAVPKVAAKVKKSIGDLKGAVRSFEESQLAKALDKYTTKSQFVNSGFDTEVIAPRLVELDLSQYATNPDKMLKALDGEKTNNLVEVKKGSGVTQNITTEKKGIIQNIHEDMKARIKEVQDANGIEVQLPVLALSQKLKARSRILTRGRNADRGDAKAAEQIIDNVLKPFERVRVPGIPFDALIEHANRTAGDVPPPTPLNPPDLFPFVKQESLVNPPELPPRPEFEGISIPNPLRAVEDMNGKLPNLPSKFNVVRRYPAKPQEPQGYAGVLSEGARKKHESDLAAWEDEVAKLEKKYNAEEAGLENQASAQIKGAERVRESLANDAIAKYDSAILAWEDEVAKLQLEHQTLLSNARKYDEKVMDTKIKHASERFIERAKRNSAYKKDIIENDKAFFETVQKGMKSVIKKEPVSVGVTDLMEIRSYIGKQLDSKDFLIDKELSKQKEIYEQLYHGLKDEIRENLAPFDVKIGKHTLPASSYYEAQSDRMRRLIQAKNILEATPRAERLKPDFAAKILAVTTAGTAGIAAKGIDYYSQALGLGESVASNVGLGALGAFGTLGAMRTASRSSPELMTGLARKGRQGLGILEQNPEVVVPFSREGLKQMRDDNQRGRMPQSVPNIPEELIRTPLPRSTQSLMEKKSFVLAKVAQMMPEMYEAVSDTYKHEPERLGEIAQVLSMKAPHLFERDKYNRYDGRILSEKDKAQAIKDTLLRKDISSVQQSKIITRLNQTGEFGE
jgi:hypothetical protein